MAFLIAALMFAASIGAVVSCPGTKAASLGSAFALEAAIPRHFGDCSEEPQWIVQVVNPQRQASLDKLYSQLLEGIYV